MAGAARALSRGLCLAVGCGLVGLCRAVPVGIRPRLACSCRFRRSRWRRLSRVAWPVSGGGCGCVPVWSVRRCSRLARFPFPGLRSRWLFLPGFRARRPARPCRRCLVCLRWFLRFRRAYVLVWFSFLSCLVFRSPSAACALVAFRRLVLPVTAAAFAPRCAAGVLMAVVAFAGSRVLPASGSALVLRVASNLAAGGASFVVGCCSGADAALLSAVPGSVPPSLVRCLCAFGPGGQGCGPISAVDRVAKFAAVGGAVEWWAGGSVSVPLRVRLAARTRAVVGSASAGLVVFFGSPSSKGSLLACRCAVARGLPVLAFPVGFSADRLPVLGAGRWVSSGAMGGYFWAKNQKEIFA